MERYSPQAIIKMKMKTNVEHKVLPTAYTANEIVFKSTSVKPVIQVKYGSLSSIADNSDCLVNVINNSLLSNEQFDTDVFNDTSVQNQLVTFYRQNVKLYENGKLYRYPIIITNAGSSNQFKHILHVYLNKFNFTCEDYSCRHFKKSIKSLLKQIVDDGKMNTITFSSTFCAKLLYPTSRVAKWLKESMNEFFQETKAFNCIKMIAIYANEPPIAGLFKEIFEETGVLVEKNELDVLTEQYTLKELDADCEDFHTVSSHFMKTMLNVKIQKIQIIKNAYLEHMYDLNKQVMNKRNPVDMVNEYKLFHGTTLESIDKICKLGFNRSYCGINGSLFGRGVYFARYASQSDFFASSHDKKNNSKIMILARVLVGSYELGRCDTIEPGYRSDVKQYDSTVDNIDSPDIFVIYRDYRALPCYLIEYT